MKKHISILATILLIFLGCDLVRVTRVDEKEQIDLSGRWNDTDSRLVSEEMVDDALKKDWISDYVRDHKRQPVVIVGLVRNKTSEHINTETFIKDIEREFINSGRVKVVQAGAARDELRQARADQQDFASPETTKKWGLELGADYILQGVVNSITDQNRRKKLVYYQVDLELSDLETNEKVWIGSKKIKKVID